MKSSNLFLKGLFPFQLEDCKHIVKSDYDNHIIANEMGTGKTYEAISLDYYRRNQKDYEGGPTLVIAPLSTIPSWHEHFSELTPLKVCSVDNKNRGHFIEQLRNQQWDVYIIHWEALRLTHEILTAVDWHHIIADEVHKAKNRKAQQTKALKKIKAPYKLAMSGTPIINRPDELWSILHWLYPKDYRSYWRFYKHYVQFEVMHPHGYHKITGTKNMDELREEIAPFIIRRLKKDVLKDLPPKYYTTLTVQLDGKQRRVYDQMRQDMIAWIGLHENEPLVAPVVIAKLVRLQQLALAYAEFDDEGKVMLSKPSAKLTALMDIVGSTDEQIVVFTQFVGMAKLVHEEIPDSALLIGETTRRGEVIEAFQKGRTRILICSIGAGGVGITLTAANKAVFLDRAWSPAMNVQAEDRLHRIGQDNAVQIIDIIGKDTVDLGRMQTLERKWTWIRELLD